MSAASVFSLEDPLPVGPLAIQASAGTGKTYTLAALTACYVAERSVRASELLVVTFTRAATSELRDRIRDRLARAARQLDDPTQWEAGDLLLPRLAGPDPVERELRVRRLERAVSEFDAATITTIHGFASQVLATLGTASGVDLDCSVQEDDQELASIICADVLAAASVAGHPAEDLPKLSRLVDITRLVLGSPDLVLLPEEPVENQPAPHLMRTLALASAERIATHRSRAGTRSYSDLLADLREAIRGPGGPAAVATLRARFRVALIDEFQDTDPVQWDIFSELFLHPVHPQGEIAEPVEATALVFVGDPKQAIYAFRGANIHTYLDAVGSVGDQRELTTNHRSDGALLDAIGTLLEGTTFGEASIGFTPVLAAERLQERRLNGPAGVLPALSIRLVHGPEVRETKGKNAGKVSASLARRAIYADLVSHVRNLLDREHLISTDAEGKPAKHVVASDIAVLVKSGDEANEVQAALLAQGVPAVLARGMSVLRSPAGAQWRWLLEALARPSDPARARTFALSWFEGRSVEWLDASTDDDMAAVHDRLHQWSATLASAGLAALLRRLWSETGLVARVLARADGDRALTDMEHVAELIRTESPSDHPSAASLLALLDDDPADDDPNTDRMGDKASRRVESDAEAVQVMTVWVSKGLEFPVVLCPTMWSHRTGGAVVYQDADRGRRVCDAAPVFSGKSPTKPWPNKEESAERKELADRERDGESLRLLYVALTRARHQTVVWWAPVQGCDRTGLARVLFARIDHAIDPDAFVAECVDIPSHDETLGILQALMAPAGDAAEVIEVHHTGGPSSPRPAVRGADDTSILAISKLAELPDRSCRRWSFTAITSGAHHGGVGPANAEPTEEVRVTLDEPAEDGHEFGRPTSDPSASPAVSSPSIVAHDSDRAPSDGSRPGAPADDLIAGEQGQLEFPAPGTDLVPPTEPEVVSASGAIGGADATSVSPLAWLPAGAEFGTLVHSVFEHVDPSAPDLDSALAAEVERQLAWRNLDLRPVAPMATEAAAGEAAAHPELDPDRATDAHGRALLVAGLRTAIDTPLGPLVHHRSLRDIGAGDRLAELGFDLRLAGHAADGAARPLPSVRRIGEIVLRYLDAHDPYRAWAQDLAAGAIDVSLAGHLTGEIDAVLRVRPDGGGPERFVVVDYKTNRLHERGREPQPGAYGPGPLVEAMHHSHYPLQALLYLVALHRYLRWRQPDYDPTVHLGGAAYLFVRGMTGPGGEVTGGVPHGVASWPVPPVLVAALSDLLAGKGGAS